MKIYSYQSELGNVGDDFNQWLWPKLIPDVFDEDDSEIFIGIGSVFDDRHRIECKKYVFGAGARTNNFLPVVDGSWEVFFVRGPLTAAIIKDAKVKCITDPGVLSSLYFEKDENANKVGIVPYFKGNHAFWQSVASDLDMVYISTHLPVDEFFEKLSQCKSVITESLHGAIFSDALRIPWKGIISYSKVTEGPVNDFKWADWLGSMNIKTVRTVFPVIWPSEYAGVVGSIKLYFKKILVKKLLKKIIKNGSFFISDDGVHNKKLDEMLMEIENFKLSRNK